MAAQKKRSFSVERRWQQQEYKQRRSWEQQQQQQLVHQNEQLHAQFYYQEQQHHLHQQHQQHQHQQKEQQYAQQLYFQQHALSLQQQQLHHQHHQQQMDTQRRVAALHDACGIMDSPPNVDVDRLCALAKDMFEVPIVLATLLDERRQWFWGCDGLDVTETPIEQAFCAHAIKSKDAVMVVPDARKDERFHANPLVTGAPAIRFYAGAPLILNDGTKVGTLCVIDTEPRPAFDERSQRILTRLAALVVVQFHRHHETVAATQQHALVELQRSASRARLTAAAAGVGHGGAGGVFADAPNSTHGAL